MAKTLYTIGQPLQNSRFKVIRNIGKIPTKLFKGIEIDLESKERSQMRERLHNLSSRQQVEGLTNGVLWMRFVVDSPANKYGQLYTFEEYKQHLKK